MKVKKYYLKKKYPANGFNEIYFLFQNTPRTIFSPNVFHSNARFGIIYKFTLFFINYVLFYAVEL